MRKALAWIGGLVILLVVIVVGVGYALPVAHVESRSAAFAHPPDRVFAAIADIENYPHWRQDVEAVEVLAWEPRVRWREFGGDTITFERVEIQPPERLVTRIADPDLPFGGTWTYELAAEGKDGTRLTITERGEVYNPVFRFMSRFVFGHAATLETFLEDLQRRLPPSS